MFEPSCSERQSISTTMRLNNYNSNSNLPQDNSTELLSSDDLKALHFVFIRELYKDRKAPVKPLMIT